MTLEYVPPVQAEQTVVPTNEYQSQNIPTIVTLEAAALSE